MKTLLLLLLSAVSALAAPSVTNLLLVDERDLSTQPANGGSLPQGVAYHGRARVNTETLSVVYVIDGTREVIGVTNQAANSASRAGDSAGGHTMTVTPWTNVNGTGVAGPAVRADYTITSGASPSPTATPATPTPTPTIAPTPTATPSPTPTLTPAPPAVNTATNITTSGFSANWQAPSPTVTGYKLDVAIDSAFSSFVTGYNDLDVGNALTKAVTGLNADTFYHYRVRAYNTGGTGLSSSTVSLKTDPNPTPTPSPTATPAVPLVTVTVLWDALIDNSYTIFYGKTPDCPMQVDGGMAFQDGPMCVAIANLDANTLYYFSSAVTWYGVRSAKLTPPIQYTTKSASNQQVELKKK